MIRRPLSASVALAVAAAVLAAPTPSSAEESGRSAPDVGDLTPAVASPAESLDKGTALTLGTGRGAETYIVQLESPAIPTRSLATKRGAGARAGQSASAYGRELRAEQADLTTAIGRVTGSEPEVLDSFTHAINGITVRLTREQAQRVARIDGVTAVQVDFTRQLTTDKGPEWIGAPTIWDGSNVPSGVGSKGEGVVVGILDTGLNPANPSFHDVVPAAEGGDDYDHTNPLGSGTYRGVCDPADSGYIPDWGCNDKVIGYWDFDVAGNADGDYDDDGHGSHTGSTTAGNQVAATAYSARGTEHEFSVTSTIKGVAPHANIIGYDVCDGAGCQGTSIVAAIDQAILDGVDVINYSIGATSPGSPWVDADAIGFLNARAAGINVATSAGNEGPGVATLGSPADSPWLTAVGATTHDRTYVSSVTDITATDASTLPDIAGAGFSGPTDTPFPLVDAATINSNQLCEAGAFPAGTDLSGEIVICLRGGNGRVEKGEVVAALGAEGMILANDEASGTSLNGDAHALPAAHITYADGVALRAYVAAHPGASAALSGSVADVADENGDIMAAFSSRGPNRAVSLISPSVSAPGVDILAAAGTDNDTDWEFISGTSMASPHTAGALALLQGVQPDWTPAEKQSALMTTAQRDITDSDGTVADWFDMGSGRIELRRAAKAGLLLDETLAGYQGADPAAAGDVRTLNTASMADDECLQTCSWTRTLTGTSTGAGTWTVAVENLSDELTLEADVDTVALTDGGTADVTLTATVAPGAATDEWLFGTLVLTPPAGSTAPVAHLPVGVLPSAGVLPTSIDVTTRRDAGSQVTSGLEAIAITDLQVDAGGLVPEQSTALSIVEDSTNTDPYDGNGTVVTEFTIPEGSTSFIAKLADPTAPDFDLYVGTGAVSEANVVAMSASGGSAEGVSIANPEPGTYWVLVQNWEASSAGGTDTVDLVSAVVTADQGNLRAEGPAGAVPAATPFDLRTFWDEPAMEAGQTWHGTLSLGSSPTTAGDIGVVPVTITRADDDVVKTADVTEVGPGGVITYTVDVAPNLTQEDLAYTIQDTLPAGTAYVEGSATGGATYADGVVSWTGDLATTYGEEGNYTLTTSAQDESCETPFGPGYLDLQGLDIDAQADVVGDTTTFSAFPAMTFGFYGQGYNGLRFSDDGFLVYGSGNYAGEPWAPQTVPDAALPNSVAAVLWQDMELRYDAGSGAGVSLASTGDAVGDVAIVEYDDMRLYDDAAGAAGQLDLQVFATAGSNDLVFAYDNVETGEILQGVTIGTENAAATAGAALVNADDATAVVTDDLVVCASYSEPEPEGASFSYQVAVGDDPVNGASIVNSAVHTTDDPGAKPATASSTVVVSGARESSTVGLTLAPSSVETGGTTTATATVASAGAAPTGTVTFLAGGRVAGSATVGAGGTATAVLEGFTTAGVVPVTASYSGDAATHAATSAPVNLAVSLPAPVRSTLKLDAPKRIKVGQKATLGIRITAGGVTPTGTVRVTVKAPRSKVRTTTVTLDKKGRASLRLGRFTKPGKVVLTVVYAGDAAVQPDRGKATIRVIPKRR